MTNVLAVHNDVVFFYYCYSTNVVVWILLWAVLACMILLCLDDMATMHLRVFDFNLRIVENVIVVVNVFDYLDWLLVLTLLLRFGGSSSSLVGTTSMMTSLRWSVALIWLESLLVMDIIWVTLMPLISWKMALVSIHSTRTSISTASLHAGTHYRLRVFNLSRCCMSLLTAILEDNLPWINIRIILNLISLQILWTSFTGLIEIKRLCISFIFLRFLLFFAFSVSLWCFFDFLLLRWTMLSSTVALLVYVLWRGLLLLRMWCSFHSFVSFFHRRIFCLNLWFLKFIQFSATETTRYILLRYIQMVLGIVTHRNGLLYGYQSC